MPGMFGYDQMDEEYGYPSKPEKKIMEIKKEDITIIPKNRSVLQDWVMKLPLREQGVLLTCIRGCDVVPKLPLDSTPRQLTAYLRYLVMVPHDERETGIPGAFFQNEPPKNWKASELGHLPQHWYSHIMHGYQIIHVRHPDQKIAERGYQIYHVLVESLHLIPESDWQMKERLSEDRIEKGNVVS